MTDAVYFLVSNKAWNRGVFESLQASVPGTWQWVDTPADLLAMAERLKPRYIFFLHWGARVPEALWSQYECVCFHMTDLPYGRGGSPLQNLILRGNKSTMVSAFRMVEDMDAGPIYQKRPMSLDGPAQAIYVRAAEISGAMIAWIAQQQPTPQPQVGEPTLFVRRKPAESHLPENLSLDAVYDFIRMLDAPGYPHASIAYGEYIIELTQAEHAEGEVRASAVIRKREGSEP